MPDPESARHRPRVLFVAEAVTLAHVARPLVLAGSLDPARYAVTLAVDPRYHGLFPNLPFPVRPIHSIAGEQFLEALAQGRPLYDLETLRAYVREELELLDETAPDLVVGDFRLSLAVSTQLRRVPYLTVTNAYWSPYARLRFPLPDLPLTRRLGVRLARLVFGLVRPVAFAYHTRPLNRLRREHGLAPLGWDLRRVYTWADYTLYADVPELVPTVDLPSNHQYLGPILWSPDVQPPPWWRELPPDRPMVYVTLGSSGPSRLLPTVLEALAEAPVTVLAATAGRGAPPRAPPNAFVAAYLPGVEAAARACLIICNGGSPTTQQALAAGRPVLGLPSNMDQYLNMAAVRRAGAGEFLRAATATVPQIRTAVDQLLGRSGYAEAAADLARTFARYDACKRFAAVVARVLEDKPVG